MAVNYNAIRLTWISVVFQINCTELSNELVLILDTEFRREVY